MKNFEEVRNFLETIPAINSGGCGISAYAMYLWLKKNNQLPEDFAIVYLYNSYFGTYEENRTYLETNEGNATSCGHAVLQMDGVYVDCERFVDTDEYNRALMISEDIIDRFMPESINAKYAWNRMFDRKYIKLIEEKLEIDLSFAEIDLYAD